MSLAEKALPVEWADEKSAHPTRRFAILGLYGQLNLGNECTLEALIADLRRKEPGCSLTAICSGPADVRKRHGIDAVPFLSNAAGEEAAKRPDGIFGKLVRPFRILFRRVPEEIRGLSRAKAVMRQQDMLIVGGTGILEDNIGWSMVWIWNLSKWILAAKRSGAVVAFVSIGAGPIQRSFDRWVMRRLLSLADFVSYRDDYSFDYMASLGISTGTHLRFPDLAFGLPVERRMKRDRSCKTVAVGVMEYVGQRNSRFPVDGAYETYVSNLAGFIRNLLDEDFEVKMLFGDARYDLGVVADIKRELGDYARSRRLTEAEIAEVDDVVRRLADSRFVVASRFHNLVLSLMMGNPTISISYHHKNDALMEVFGLPECCHDIDAFDGGRLMEQFRDLVRKEDEMESHILETAARFQTEVDRQYDLLLNLSFDHATRQSGV